MCDLVLSNLGIVHIWVLENFQKGICSENGRSLKAHDLTKTDVRAMKTVIFEKSY